MFNDDEPIAFQNMHDFSTADGFVEVTVNLADMIKLLANEPSVGLFYVQQHTQNATPNLINLKTDVVEKSYETALHTEDLDDSITMVGSMKECGHLIANTMIGEIKRSLSIMSSRPPRRTLIRSSTSSSVGEMSYWSPTNWDHNRGYSQLDEGTGTNSGYLSSVFRSAKQKAESFKWPQVESIEASQSDGEVASGLTPETLSAVYSSSSTIPDAGSEDFPLSSANGSKLQRQSQLSKSLSHQQLLFLYDNYDEFKASQEAKLEQWLVGTGKEENFGREGSSRS